MVYLLESVLRIWRTHTRHQEAELFTSSSMLQKHVSKYRFAATRESACSISALQLVTDQLLFHHHAGRRQVLRDSRQQTPHSLYKVKRANLMFAIMISSMIQ